MELKSEWNNIQSLRTSLTKGRWKSCPDNDLYQLTLLLMFNYRYHTTRRKLLYYHIPVPDILNIIIQYAMDSDMNNFIANDYESCDEKIYHMQIKKQLQSWACSTLTIYSNLFVSDLDHLIKMNENNMIHERSNVYNIIHIDNVYIINIQTLVSYSLYLMTCDGMSLGFVYGIGYMISNVSIILLTVQRSGVDIMYEINISCLQKNKDWLNVHNLIKELGTFYMV